MTDAMEDGDGTDLRAEGYRRNFKWKVIVSDKVREGTLGVPDRYNKRQERIVCVRMRPVGIQLFSDVAAF